MKKGGIDFLAKPKEKEGEKGDHPLNRGVKTF